MMALYTELLSSRRTGAKMTSALRNSCALADARLFLQGDAGLLYCIFLGADISFFPTGAHDQIPGLSLAAPRRGRGEPSLR